MNPHIKPFLYTALTVMVAMAIAAIAWRVASDTAHEEEDFADVGTQTLTFGPGATVARALIPLVNDGVRESPETFTVHLSRPRGGIAGDVTATRVTVHDDD